MTHTHMLNESLGSGRSAATRLNSTLADTINETNLPCCEIDIRNTANKCRLTRVGVTHTHTHTHTLRTQVPTLCSVSHNHTQTVNTFTPNRILNLRTEGDKHIYHTSTLSFFISVHFSATHLHSLHHDFLPSITFLCL